jgi:hypothetical protein
MGADRPDQVGTFGPAASLPARQILAARPSTASSVEGEDPMLACPRCGDHADFLADEVFSLLRCEFCGEDLDAADLLREEDLDRIAHGLLPASWEELLPPLEAEFV